MSVGDTKAQIKAKQCTHQKLCDKVIEAEEFHVSWIMYFTHLQKQTLYFKSIPQLIRQTKIGILPGKCVIFVRIATFFQKQIYLTIEIDFFQC